MEAIHMNNNQESSDKSDIICKQEQIDNYLENNEYSRAFGILLDLIKTLNPDDKRKIWEHYENKVFSNPKNNNNMFPTDPYFHSK